MIEDLADWVCRLQRRRCVNVVAPRIVNESEPGATLSGFAIGADLDERRRRGLDGGARDVARDPGLLIACPRIGCEASHGRECVGGVRHIERDERERATRAPCRMGAP